MLFGEYNADALRDRLMDLKKVNPHGSNYTEIISKVILNIWWLSSNILGQIRIQ